MVYFTEVATEVAVAGCDYDLPAIVYKNGTREWYQDGKLHRNDGPAIIFRNRKSIIKMDYCIVMIYPQ